MKAMVQTRYGGPEVFEAKDVPQPVPKASEVLVKIHATAINDYDWSLMRGKPFIYRLMFGFSKPKNPIPGMELAGTVEAIGSEVTQFKVGDAVYGDTSDHGFGTFAEYMCVDAKALAHKPEGMSFAEATTIPHAAMLAVQGLRDVGQLQQGQKILINGAGGGVGTFALQLAKLQQAHVTGVDTGAKLQDMKAMGFDEVIDYKQTNFTRTGERYDLILDAKTGRSPFAYLRALKPKGHYVTVGGRLRRLLQLLVFKAPISWFSSKRVSIVALKPNKDLAYINELYQDGNIRCTIDGPYPLEEAPQRIQYFGEGKHSGKIVLEVKPS